MSRQYNLDPSIPVSSDNLADSTHNTESNHASQRQRQGISISGSNVNDDIALNRIDDEQAYEKAVVQQISVIRHDLILASVIPFLALLSIGGSPGLFTIAFGCIGCYILDLLETVEVSIFILDALK